MKEGCLRLEALSSEKPHDREVLNQTACDGYDSM